MHPLTVAQILALLTVANGAPVVAKKLLGTWMSWPLDFHVVLPDGHRLFGAAKTIRGVAVAIVSGWAAAPLIGLDAGLGAWVGVLAMVGDLVSSFIKRRLNLPPSSQAIVLDQVPESFLPLLACAGPLGLTTGDVAAGVVIFFIGELLISRLLFRLHVRDEPY